jgi:pilus assembly protein Flp/PilA
MTLFSSFKKITSTVSAFLVVHKDGATAIEYALIAAGIATVIVAIVFTLGGTTSGMYSTVNTKIAGAAP